MGKQWKQWLTLFFWAPKSLQMVIAAMKLKDVYSLESYDQPRQHIKKQRITLSTKVRLVKAMVFPVVMYGCESWTTKKAECPRIDAFELWCWRRFWRIPWTARRSNQSILKEISPGCSLVGLILKLILWPPDVKSWLIWKDPDAGKDWGQEEKGTAENEVIVGHHRLNGHGFGWTPGVGDGQGGLAYCGSWGCKESDATERLNWTEWSSVLHFSKWSQLMVKLNYQSPL